MTTEPETYDVVPGLELIRAIASMNADAIQAATDSHEPQDLVRALASVALSWGYQLHGPQLAGHLDALLLDLSIDPLTPTKENPEP